MNEEQKQKISETKDRVEKLKFDYEMVFSTPQGQRVLKDILACGYMFRSTYNPDINLTMSNEGKRVLALHIQDMSVPRPEPKQENAITGGK